MALIEVTADLKRTAMALERIADALVWLLRIQIDPRARKAAFRAIYEKESAAPAGPEAISAPTDEQLWDREQEEARQRQAESDGESAA